MKSGVITLRFFLWRLTIQCQQKTLAIARKTMMQQKSGESRLLLLPCRMGRDKCLAASLRMHPCNCLGQKIMSYTSAAGCVPHSDIEDLFFLSNCQSNDAVIEGGNMPLACMEKFSRSGCQVPATCSDCLASRGQDISAMMYGQAHGNSLNACHCVLRHKTRITIL